MPPATPPRRRALVVESGLTEEPWIEYADIVVSGFGQICDRRRCEQFAVAHLAACGYLAAGWQVVATPRWRGPSWDEADALHFELIRHRYPSGRPDEQLSSFDESPRRGGFDK